MVPAERRSEIRLKEIGILIRDKEIPREEKAGMMFEAILLKRGLGFIDEDERKIETDVFLGLLTLSANAGLAEWSKEIVRVNFRGDPVTRLGDIRDRTVARLCLDGLQLKMPSFAQLIRQAA